MSKIVKLILEYDAGDHADWEKETGEKIPTDPEYWEDFFYQTDVLSQDLVITGVKIEENPDK